MNEREEFQDAKVVKAMQMTGIFKWKITVIQKYIQKRISEDGQWVDKICAMFICYWKD